MQYINTADIEETCNYDKLMNRFMHAFRTACIIMTPRTFEDQRRPTGPSMAFGHFTNILCVEWLRESSKRLKKWDETISNYFCEFSGSWKFYAAAKRLDMINEYGADEDDYDENGEIKKDGLTDEELSPYTVLHELYDSSFRDIIQDFEPGDAYNFISTMKAEASLDLRDAFGKRDIPVYSYDEEGELRKMTSEELDLQKISKEVDAGDLSIIFINACSVLWYICREFERMGKEHNCEDNRDFLHEMQYYVQQLMNLEMSQELLDKARGRVLEFLDAKEAALKNTIEEDLED